MKTKILTFFLALTLCLALLPVAVAADGADTLVPDGFLFAVTKEGEVVTDPAQVPEEGATAYSLTLSSRASEVRRVWPSGIRFATSVPCDQMDALLACDAVASVQLGTRILPRDLLGEGDLMSSVDAVDVPATVGQWYASIPSAYLFAGSITDIKAANHGREFVGVGYAIVTLKNGAVLTVQAKTAASGVYGRLAEALIKDSNVTLTDEARAFFEAAVQTMLVADLNELNVLAIGDSLFDGDYLAGKNQWIGLLATECKWNFTNLGHDGWTVAYNPDVYAPGQNVRKSMYDYLFNHSDIYRFGGSNASHERGTLYNKTAEDVDLILLEGGVNDYNWNIPLGTVNDTDGSTLLGAWRLMIDKLLVDYPNATIVFVTSWYVEAQKTVDGEVRQRMDYVCNGIKSLFAAHYAGEARFTVIDAGNPAVSGINMADYSFRLTYAKNTSDTNHLNENGMKLMQTFMRRELWELLVE